MPLRVGSPVAWNGSSLPSSISHCQYAFLLRPASLASWARCFAEPGTPGLCHAAWRSSLRCSAVGRLRTCLLYHAFAAFVYASGSSGQSSLRGRGGIVEREPPDSGSASICVGKPCCSAAASCNSRWTASIPSLKKAFLSLAKSRAFTFHLRKKFYVYFKLFFAKRQYCFLFVVSNNLLTNIACSAFQFSF